MGCDALHGHEEMFIAPVNMLPLLEQYLITVT
jgi:hypothetical protein